MLLELHHQFDVLDAEADWSGYRVVVIADRGRPTGALTSRLKDYLHGGGDFSSRMKRAGYRHDAFALARRWG